jgi:hypothetical protein
MVSVLLLVLGWAVKLNKYMLLTGLRDYWGRCIAISTWMGCEAEQINVADWSEGLLGSVYC